MLVKFKDIEKKEKKQIKSILKTYGLKVRDVDLHINGKILVLKVKETGTCYTFYLK